jgi:hypothetical protein
MNQLCGTPFDDGSDCGGGGGYYFIPGGGIGYSNGGNPALNEVNALQGRMEASSTTTITYDDNGDGVADRTVTVVRNADGSVTTGGSTGGADSSTFEVQSGDCSEGGGRVRCSTNATLTYQIDNQDVAEIMLFRLSPLADPFLIGGRAPIRLAPSQTFNEGIRPVRATPPRPLLPANDPPPRLGPTLQQQVPRMPPWYRFIHPFLGMWNYWIGGWDAGIVDEPDPCAYGCA